MLVLMILLVHLRTCTHTHAHTHTHTHTHTHNLILILPPTQCDSKYVIGFFGAFFHEERIFVCTEYMDGEHPLGVHVFVGVKEVVWATADHACIDDTTSTPPHMHTHTHTHMHTHMRVHTTHTHTHMHTQHTHTQVVLWTNTA